MDYNLFQDILNKQIFESSKQDLLEKISKYLGLFRPTKPKAKLLQNLLQSNEIRFGDAPELLFEKYFELSGFTILEKKIGHGKEYLDLDQLFRDDGYIYFVEQKVRDDHDSTKKRGQINNFEKKISALLLKYKETEIKCFTCFVDPGLVKNKKYYTGEIKKIQAEYNVYTKLCYGKELWKEIGHPEVWEEIVKYLEKWKAEIPDMPSINFDENPINSFEEIKSVGVSLFRKLFSNRDICREIMPILFPEKKVLHLLHGYFMEKSAEGSIYKNLAEKIKTTINEL
jgi:hypothetical protein